MTKEIIVEGIIYCPDSIEEGGQIKSILEANINPYISYNTSKKKELKHLHSNSYSLCGEIKKIRTGSKVGSKGLNTQMIVDCTQPVLVTLNFTDDFKNIPNFNNYKNIPVWPRIPYRIFYEFYYNLVNIYKIGSAKSLPIFIRDKDVIRLKFLEEGDYIQIQCSLFSYLDGGSEENLLEQKFVGVVHSLESYGNEIKRNKTIIWNPQLVRLKILEVHDIKYTDSDNLLDLLKWAICITSLILYILFISIIGWLLLIITGIVYILFLPLIGYIKLFKICVRISKGDKSTESFWNSIKKNPFNGIVEKIISFLVSPIGIIVKIIDDCDDIEPISDESNLNNNENHILTSLRK